SSAPAIVTYFVLPPVFSTIANVWGFLADKAVWIDLGTAQRPLFDAGNLTGEQWAQLGVTLLIWVILPFLAGLWRVLRAELK
ncbi:MAG: ABC transporter permease, partial [Mycobacteriales bacterium]